MNGGCENWAEIRKQGLFRRVSSAHSTEECAEACFANDKCVQFFWGYGPWNGCYIASEGCIVENTLFTGYALVREEASNAHFENSMLNKN